MNKIEFQSKKIILSSLESFGFIKTGDIYTYSRDILDNQFSVTITVGLDKQTAEIIDKSSGEEYVLHLVPGASGAFIGQVRQEYDSLLSEISEKCCKPNIFKSDYAHKLIEYVSDRYGDELEYLWEKFPDNAIWRRKDSKKWYAVLMIVSKRKLGIDSDETAEIIDLRANAESLTDNVKYFPGYHMNKKHWITICLNGSIPIEEIYKRVDMSYSLADK